MRKCAPRRRLRKACGWQSNKHCRISKIRRCRMERLFGSAHTVPGAWMLRMLWRRQGGIRPPACETHGNEAARGTAARIRCRHARSQDASGGCSCSSPEFIKLTRYRFARGSAPILASTGRSGPSLGHNLRTHVGRPLFASSLDIANRNRRALSVEKNASRGNPKASSRPIPSISAPV